MKRSPFLGLACLALAGQLWGCSTVLKMASQADNVSTVGKAADTAVDASRLASHSDEAAQLASRAGDEAAQTGEVVGQVAADTAKGTDAAQVAEVAGHAANAADLLTSVYDAFEDSAEEDDSWEAEEQQELEQATADLRKVALSIPSHSPGSLKDTEQQLARLESQVKKSAQSRDLKDMKEAGRLGTELTSHISALRSNATMDPP